MNINEFYGDITFPSDIADSFEGTIHEANNSEHSCSHSSHNDSDVNLDSSLEDTFLDQIVIPTEPKANKDEQPQLSLSRPEIVLYAHPRMQLKQSVEITNCTSRPTLINIKSPFPVVHVSLPSQEIIGTGEFYVLKGWEKAEVTFLLKQGEDQFGDIFDTVVFETKFKDDSIKPTKTNYRMEVTVHYVNPKMKITYQGCSDLMTTYGNKVLICELGANKRGEYQIQLAFEQVQRIECSLEVIGDLEIFPKELVFYKGESRKINIRKDRLPQDKKSAVVVRAKDGSSLFVFGIKII